MLCETPWMNMISLVLMNPPPVALDSIRLRVGVIPLTLSLIELMKS